MFVNIVHLKKSCFLLSLASHKVKSEFGIREFCNIIIIKLKVINNEQSSGSTVRVTDSV